MYKYLYTRFNCRLFSIVHLIVILCVIILVWHQIPLSRQVTTYYRDHFVEHHHELTRDHEIENLSTKLPSERIQNDDKVQDEEDDAMAFMIPSELRKNPGGKHKGKNNDNKLQTTRTSIMRNNPYIQQCSDEQFRLVREMLPNQDEINWQTNCPDNTWIHPIDNFVNVSSSSSSSLSLSTTKTTHQPLAIFVGCNKAMDAIDTLRFLSRNETYDKSVWRSTLHVTSSACQQHIMPQVPLKNLAGRDRRRNSMVPRQATVYCIEPMPSTYQQLRRAVSELHWNDSLRVYHAAMSNVNGHVLFPNDEATVGVENLGISDCQDDDITDTNTNSSTNTKTKKFSSCENVTMYTLDQFVHDVIDGYHDDAQRQKNNDDDDAVRTDNQAHAPMVDILSIDAEGHDWPVIQGAVDETLKHRTKYVEFEYHHVGRWKETKLSTVTMTLERLGYVCYWAGRMGKLWRITDCGPVKSWDKTKQWSNIACVHEHRASKLMQRMEDRFLETLRKYQKQSSASSGKTGRAKYPTMHGGTTHESNPVVAIGRG